MSFHRFGLKMIMPFKRALVVFLVTVLALCFFGCKKKDKDQTSSDSATESITSTLDTDIFSERLESTDDEFTATSDSANQNLTEWREQKESNACTETSVKNSEGANPTIVSDKDMIRKNSHQEDKGQSADKKESPKETKPSLESTLEKETDSIIKDDAEKKPESVETSVAKPNTPYHNGIELPDIFF